MEADRSALLALVTEPFKIIPDRTTIPDDSDYTDEMNATPRKLVWEPLVEAFDSFDSFHFHC